MKRYLPWIIGLVVVAALTVSNKNNVREETLATCLGTDPFFSKTKEKCDCFADRVTSSIPNTAFLPVIGPMLFVPSENDMRKVAALSVTFCERAIR